MPPRLGGIQLVTNEKGGILAKLTVGVVFGGRSVEHEVSLVSAKSVISNTDKDKYEVFPIFIDKEGIWRRASIDAWLGGGELDVEMGSFLTPSLGSGEPLLYEIAEGKPAARHKIDVIFPVLHGTFGEDGTVQGLFELMGVPFVGAGVLGSSVGMDKIMMKAVLKDSGLPVPEFVGFYKHEWEADRNGVAILTMNLLGMPCFVKAANLGSSVGVTKAKNGDELEKAIDYACKFSSRIIVEKAVEKPREIEISVLGNEEPVASCAGEVIPHREFYDYKAKYLEEGTGLVAPAELGGELTALLQDYAIRTFKALDCSGLGRVDFLIEEGTGAIYISEINTIPGFTNISMYPRLWEESGLSFKDLVSRLIELALERAASQKAFKTDFRDEI